MPKETEKSHPHKKHAHKHHHVQTLHHVVHTETGNAVSGFEDEEAAHAFIHQLEGTKPDEEAKASE